MLIKLYNIIIIKKAAIQTSILNFSKISIDFSHFYINN